MKGEQGKTIHPFLRIEAVDGKELAPGELKLKRRVKANDMACTLSHAKAIRYAKEQGLKSVIVFEDDIELGTDFDSKLEELLNNTPKDYTMLFFNGTFGTLQKPVRFSEYVWRVYEMYGAFGYIVNSIFYDVIIKELELLAGVIGTDYIYSRLMMRHKIYRAVKPIVFHREGFSVREERIPTMYKHLKKKPGD